MDDATAASVEAHVVVCELCRSEVAGLADTNLAAASWEAVADRIDRPRSSLLEAMLRMVGVSSGAARLAAATPGLRLSGLAAVAVLTALAVAATRYTDATGTFLALAPLVPLAAVSLTFAAATEPSGEAGIATPLHGGGLVVRRASAVLGAAFIVLGVGAVAAPSVGTAPLGWILPAAAMALGSLALGTWVRLESAVIGLATGWIVGLGAARYASGLDGALADTAVFTPAGQGLALVLALAAAAALAARADRYSMMEATL